MPKRGRGPKPTNGERNIDKYETKSHIGPSFVGENSKQTQTHHARIVHLSSGSSSPGVTQPSKGKNEASRTHSQPSQPIESHSRGKKMMAY